MEEPRKAKLGFLLLGAMLVSATALLFFGWLAEEVLEVDTEGFDTFVRAAVHRVASPPHYEVDGSEFTPRVCVGARGVELAGDFPILLLPSASSRFVAGDHNGRDGCARSRVETCFSSSPASRLLWDVPRFV
jgi:hypothetical protein